MRTLSRGRTLIAIAALLVPLAGPPALAADEPWRTASQPPATRVNQLIAVMSAQDKVDLVTGNYAPLAKYGIPALNAADASSGIRGEKGVTAFPVPEALGATFDTALATQYGRAIADEGRAKGFNLLLGPTVDLVRSGFSGRQTESFSEDPRLSGDLGARVAKGMKSQKVISTVEHYSAYNQEYNRDSVDVRISERALQETQNAPFFDAVTTGGADSVMCSYPKINGVYACENPQLLDQLRRTTGWQGFVMSDFSAGTNRVAGFKAGVDTTTLWPDFPKGALSNGTIPASRIDQAARRILFAVFASGVFDNPLPTTKPATVTNPARQALAQSVAESSAVLLKNAGGVLPLKKNTKQSIAVIGPAGADAITGVGGSTYVEPGDWTSSSATSTCARPAGHRSSRSAMDCRTPRSAATRSRCCRSAATPLASGSR